MVRGLEMFRNYFSEFTDNYIIIGGAACDIIIDNAGFTPRATKDIDIILVVEALNSDFVNLFWKFIKEGGYENKEKITGNKNYFRFIKPSDQRFPYQLELFARNFVLFDLINDSGLTPVPVDNALSSLSAILLDDDYYDFILSHSVVGNDGIHMADTVALMVMKAKAYIDLYRRKAEGENIDSRNIRKHKNDIFRLALMLNSDISFDLPYSIKKDFMAFLLLIKNDLPPVDMYRAMGVNRINSLVVLKQIKESFRIEDNW